MKDQASKGLMPVMKIGDSDKFLHVNLSGDKEKVKMVGAEGKCRFREAEKAENLMHIICWGPK
ncbi:hypothetical protein SESBI_33044 [Sesbania bispinosa]|nr:hypothetical protein SESBI_33044 [Sesbania bispinosa]